MKNIALTTLVLLAFAQVSHAANISIAPSNPSPTNIFALTLDAGAPEVFNNVFIEVTPIGSAEFQNPAAFTFDSGVGGEDKTYINAQLVTPPFQGGLGWSPVGANATGSILTAGMGPLGAFIPTTNPIFLANVSLPPGAQANYLITFNNTGQEVFRAQGVLGVPEPSTMALAGLSLIGLVLRRRNG